MDTVGGPSVGAVGRRLVGWLVGWRLGQVGVGWAPPCPRCLPALSVRPVAAGWMALSPLPDTRHPHSQRSALKSVYRMAREEEFRRMHSASPFLSDLAAETERAAGVERPRTAEGRGLQRLHEKKKDQVKRVQSWG